VTTGGALAGGCDVERALTFSCAECASRSDAGSPIAETAGSCAGAGVAGGTIVDGRAVANHMIKTPVAIPPANDSVVFAGRRRRFRIWPIHIGTSGIRATRARKILT